MRTPLTAIVLSIVGGAACAQSANEGIKGLESCFQAARLADAICSNATNDAVQRLDCFRKARAAQLECLEHVPSGTSAGSAAPEIPTTGIVSPATPPRTARPEMPTPVSPGMPAATPSAEVPAGSVSPRMPAGTVPSEMNIETDSVNEPNGIVSPKSPAAAIPAEVPTATVSPDKPFGAVPPDMPARTVDIPAKPPDTNWVVSETNWVVSETMSPIDYSPLITAAIHSTSSEKDAPDTLAIRCRQLRTELVLRSEGTWRISRASEVQVDYQINDQSVVSLQWAGSADGKAATYKDDAVNLLRSLPEGARLKINVFDGHGPGHGATFQLTGLDAIRKKIAVACNWPPMVDKMSSGKR
jgi:hypothetical protein